MYLLENPVLQRELLVNLRMPRAFVLLLVYQLLLAVVVYAAWPTQERLDLSRSPREARQLVDLFFIGQYLLVGMMAPSFAAGTISGEKERKTYEMLLASPLKPFAIVLGKLLASLTHLAALVFASLPIAMLCLPLGGAHPFEVGAAYLGLIVSVILFGAISLACSSHFKRTSSALVVSYLLILPLALLEVLFWRMTAGSGMLRLIVSVTVIPLVGLVVTAALLSETAARLLHPPDVGSEGSDVVDLEQELEQAVGLVIQRDQFPDKLFAPAKRLTLMEDGTNPVYDKEIRSEIFSQGTLMLRLVIQVSMALALPMMAFCLFIYPQWAPWYIAYVLLFNLLVGPVFSAGSVTSERERRTLDLLLTTVIPPRWILWGKLLAGLRISGVLTSFVLWPIFLAGVLQSAYWSANNVASMFAFLAIVAATCVLAATIGMFCSTLFHRTASSLMATYLVLITLFLAPVACQIFTRAVIRNPEAVARVDAVSFTSPFSTAFSLPFRVDTDFRGEMIITTDAGSTDWWPLLRFGIFAVLLETTLLVVMRYLFRSRWRVAT